MNRLGEVVLHVHGVDVAVALSVAVGVAALLVAMDYFFVFQAHELAQWDVMQAWAVEFCVAFYVADYAVKALEEDLGVVVVA